MYVPSMLPMRSRGEAPPTPIILGVTGHRPHKLGGYDTNSSQMLIALASDEIARINPDLIITGMALGWDTAVAKAAHSLGIPFIAAVPFSSQESRWRLMDQLEYTRLLKLAKEVITISTGDYSAYAMQLRNEYIVRNSTKILALWNGSPGGTANCIRYATMQANKPVENCYARWKELHSCQ